MVLFILSILSTRFKTPLLLTVTAPCHVSVVPAPLLSVTLPLLIAKVPLSLIVTTAVSLIESLALFIVREPIPVPPILILPAEACNVPVLLMAPSIVKLLFPDCMMLPAQASTPLTTTLPVPSRFKFEFDAIVILTACAI